MSLIKTIYNDMISARKAGNSVTKNLMVTLYSEAAMVGKNKRNGDTTDEETVAVVKKFLANAEETAKLLTERNQDSSAQAEEISVLGRYIPSQLDRSALECVVSTIITDQNLSGPKAMGIVMAELKKNYSGQYDGKIASEVVKSLLAV